MIKSKFTPGQLEELQIATENGGNWQFFLKLMYMLQSGRISISEPNFDIYKKVVGAIAEDNMKELEEKAMLYKEYTGREV